MTQYFLLTWLFLGILGVEDGVQVPSLTPFSDWDLEYSFTFTEHLQKPIIRGKWRTLQITAYTDAPQIWTPLRFKYALRLARWNLSQCKIRLSPTKLYQLPPRSLSDERGIVREKIKRVLIRGKGRHETLLFLTKAVNYRFRKNGGGRYPLSRLLGLSSMVRSKNLQGKWQWNYAVWVRWSPILTTLVHELGHRLGLPHTRRPYDLMLTGYYVRSSPQLLLSSIKGFFDARLFHFDKKQCLKMSRLLKEEEEREARGGDFSQKGKKSLSTALKRLGKRGKLR